MYHLVSFGSSGVMSSEPIDSKTFGVILPAAIAASSASGGLPWPEYLYPSAALKVGPATFWLSDSRDDA